MPRRNCRLIDLPIPIRSFDCIDRHNRPIQTSRLNIYEKIGRFKNQTLKANDTIARYKNRTLRRTNTIARYKNRNLKPTDCVDRYNRKIESVLEDRTIGPFAHLCLQPLQEGGPRMQWQLSYSEKGIYWRFGTGRDHRE